MNTTILKIVKPKYNNLYRICWFQTVLLRYTHYVSVQFETDIYKWLYLGDIQKTVIIQMCIFLL